MSTAVIYHPATRLHQAWAGHAERPERIEAVLEALRAPAVAPLVTWVEAAPAERAALERVHPAGYLDALEALAAAVVVLLWRRYRRALAEVEAGRREMVEQVESIRRLLNESHQQN